MKLNPMESYLNGNPAMLEIWTEAQDRIDNGEELTEVQRVIVREWVTRATIVRWALEDRAQRGFLTDEEYAELAALRSMIERMEQYG